MQLSTLPYKIKRATEVYTRYYLRQEMPVLVYCTGRVGSIAMFNALYEHGVFAFKLEHMDAAQGQRGTVRWVYRHIAKPQRPAKLIFIVRNPVALMVSDFLPKLRWMVDADNAHETLSTAELCEVFNTTYFAQGRHTQKLNWFDEQPKRLLGVDVYTHPFPHEQGYTRFQSGVYDVLIVRTELDDTVKSRVVGEFVGVPDLTITRMNVGETNRYGEAYRAFKEHLTIRQAHLDTIFASRYARHFYGADELRRMNARWLP